MGGENCHPCIFSKIKMMLLILSCLIASSFALVHPKCKTESAEIETQLCRVEPTKVCGTEEDGEIVFQHVVPGEPVCIDVVDTFCRLALKEEDSCKEVTRQGCRSTIWKNPRVLCQ